MNGILVFLAEVAASVAISMLVLVRLQHLLRRLPRKKRKAMSKARS